MSAVVGLTNSTGHFPIKKKVFEFKQRNINLSVKKVRVTGKISVFELLTLWIKVENFPHYYYNLTIQANI